MAQQYATVPDVTITVFTQIGRHDHSHLHPALAYLPVIPSTKNQRVTRNTTKKYMQIPFVPRLNTTETIMIQKKRKKHPIPSISNTYLNRIHGFIIF